MERCEGRPARRGGVLFEVALGVGRDVEAAEALAVTLFGAVGVAAASGDPRRSE